MIPPSHPRAESLRIRAMLERGFAGGIVSAEGLMAHGRGEAFDYMIGERTRAPALRAVKAAACALRRSQKSAVSVNGNTAALCASSVAELASAAGAEIEVNTFYGPPARRARIAELLRRRGARRVFGAGRRRHRIPGLEGPRGAADRAVQEADTVVVALEDGGRAEALERAGKTVIAIDLNPFSRTARRASITIVDNVVRALPLLARHAAGPARAARFDNTACLREMARIVRRGA